MVPTQFSARLAATPSDSGEPDAFTEFLTEGDWIKTIPPAGEPGSTEGALSALPPTARRYVARGRRAALDKTCHFL